MLRYGCSQVGFGAHIQRCGICNVKEPIIGFYRMDHESLECVVVVLYESCDDNTLTCDQEKSGWWCDVLVVVRDDNDESDDASEWKRTKKCQTMCESGRMRDDEWEARRGDGTDDVRDDESHERGFERGCHGWCHESSGRDRELKQMMRRREDSCKQFDPTSRSDCDQMERVELWWMFFRSFSTWFKVWMSCSVLILMRGVWCRSYWVVLMVSDPLAG